MDFVWVWQSNFGDLYVFTSLEDAVAFSREWIDDTLSERDAREMQEILSEDVSDSLMHGWKEFAVEDLFWCQETKITRA